LAEISVDYGHMALNVYLSEWLKDAARACSGCDIVDETECCVTIGRMTLNLPTDCDFQDVCQALSTAYGVEITSDSHLNVAEYILLYAVTESGDSTFVETIMGYDVEAQVHLKGIIENMMSAGGDDDPLCDAGESPVEFIVEDVTTMPSRVPDNPVVHVQKVTLERSVQEECMLCADKNSQLRRLQLELNQVTAQFQADIVKLKEENSVVLNKNVDMEIQIMEKESALFEKEQALREFEVQKEKLESATLQNSKLEEQLLALQDEVELLKPQAAELDRAEAQLLKYRAKLDELTDVRDQLAAESASHTETFVKLTALEQEVDGLRKLKPQLDEYRTQYAEASIAIQELQLRLETSESLVARLRTENDSLRGDQSDTRQQTQLLAEELKTTAEQLREKERTNGIGEGMSELNPALMQELNRLRAENKELSEKLDATALSALQSLEKESAEVKCVNTSLQKKWMATKDALEQAQRDIQSLTFRLCEKVGEFDALKQQTKEAAVMQEEDQQARRAIHARKLAFMSRSHEDAMTLTHVGHNAVFGIYAMSLQQAHSTLECTQQEVVQLTEKQEQTEQDLAGAKEELQEAGRKRKFMEEEHEERVVQMQGEFEARLGEHGQRHQADLSALEARMRQEVAAEQLRVAELAAQVEQDTVRMRKLTNQKRVQEQEVARLKTQLRSAVSSDAVGEGVSEAMFELKSMEQQLKDAHAEIATLRSRVAAAGEAGRGVITAGASGAVGGYLGAPARLTAAEQAHAMVAVPAEGAFGSLSYAGYLEQADYTEKRIKQLADEKRSLIAKNLEEVREKNELLQKLLAIEKEFSDLKSEKRKIELDNRRMDARLEKLLSAQTGGNKENVVN
jgi:hypothetical protein